MDALTPASVSSAPVRHGGRFVYCVPPHTHALLRLRVQSVTSSHVAYYLDSAVAVDRMTGVPLAEVPEDAGEGPVAAIPRAELDVARAFEGVAPERPRFYSSFESFDLLRELALVRYGTSPAAPPPPDDTLADLRRQMMDAHPDHGGSEETFAEARRAYEAARRQHDR